MDIKNQKTFCNLHGDRDAIGICSVKSCPQPNLCLHCLNVHDGSHNKRIIFLDENIWEPDSLVSTMKNEIDWKFNEIAMLLENKANAEYSFSIEIDKYLNNLLATFAKTLKEKKDELIRDFRMKANMENPQKTNVNEINRIFQELEGNLIKDMDLIHNIVSKIQIWEDRLKAKVDSYLDVSQMNFTITNNYLVNTVKEKLNEVISTVTIDSIFGEKSDFKYSGKDFDNKGLFYFLGTEMGTKDWSNPGDGPYLETRCSNLDTGNTNMIVGNKLDLFYTKNEENSWGIVQLKRGLKFKPTHYTLGYSNTTKKFGMPRTWNFEGSNDGSKWDIIKSHSNDKTLTEDHRSHTFAVNSKEFYSQFRIQMKGPESNGKYFLTISGMELYGLGKNILNRNFRPQQDLSTIKKTFVPLFFDKIDEAGLFYWLGTNMKTTCWENPRFNYLNLTASSVDFGSIRMLTCLQMENFYTMNTKGSWVSIELLHGMKFKPTHYRYCFSSTKFNNGLIRNWNFEGSNNGLDWTVIKKHTNDSTITYEQRINVFRVETNSYFKFFRINQWGTESNGRNYLSATALDLYGHLN